LKDASIKLRDHYIAELIECLVEQPLSKCKTTTHYVSREEQYIDLAVLEAEIIDNDWHNSDRQSMIKQKHLKLSSIDINKLFQSDDELVFIRGVAGIGKSTLIDMYTLKWAKGELKEVNFDFVFTFTCREINTYEEITCVDQIFSQVFPQIFRYITLEDLSELGDRVLIIVDGLDELQDIYKMDSKKQLQPTNVQHHLQIVFQMINSKSKTLIPHHKSIACGRPRACDYLRSLLVQNHKTKLIEVCGFNPKNIAKYIKNFFHDKINKSKAKTITDALKNSKNLQVMASVPVFLWVICNVYDEELLTESLNTYTELNFYACLIFIRNHLQGTTNRIYDTLNDLIEDECVMNVIFSLMTLSVQTYMNNQVLFTEEDIKSLQCPIHLEQTGFIVKVRRDNLSKAVYQFRHLILQEFLCAVYLNVTKWINPHVTNRELSSCIPTLFGIERILKDKNNELFIGFFRGLVSINENSFFSRILGPYRRWTYRRYFDMIPKIPIELLKNGKLLLDNSAESREFMALVFESKFKFNTSEIDSIEIQDIYTIIDLRNATHLVKTFEVPVTYLSLSVEPHVNTNVVELISVLNLGKQLKLYIALRYSMTTATKIECDNYYIRLFLPTSRHLYAENFELLDGILSNVNSIQCYRSEYMNQLMKKIYGYLENYADTHNKDFVPTDNFTDMYIW